MPSMSPSYNRGSTSFTRLNSGTRLSTKDNGSARAPARDFWAELQASNGEAFFPASIAGPSVPHRSRLDATPRTLFSNNKSNRARHAEPSARATQPSPSSSPSPSPSSSRQPAYSCTSRGNMYSNDDEDYSPSQSQEEEEDEEEEEEGGASGSVEGEAFDAVGGGRNAQASSSRITDLKASRVWTSREEEVLKAAVKKCGLRWSLVAKEFRKARTGTVRTPKALSHRWYDIGQRVKMQQAAAKSRAGSSRAQQSSAMATARRPTAPRSLSPGLSLQRCQIWEPEETQVLLKSLRDRLKSGESPPWFENCKDYFSAFPDSTRSYPTVQKKCRDLAKELAEHEKDLFNDVPNQSARTSSSARITRGRTLPAFATRDSQGQDEAARRSTDSIIDEEHELAEGAGASSEPFHHQDEAPSMELCEETPAASSTSISPQGGASSSMTQQPQHEPQSHSQARRHQSQPQPQAAPAAARRNVVDVDVIHQENGVRIESNSGGYEVKIFAPLHVKIITAQEAAAATSTTTSSFGQASEPAFHFIVSDTTAIRAPRLPADTEMSVATTVVGQGAEAVVYIDRMWEGPCGYKAVFRSSV